VKSTLRRVLGRTGAMAEKEVMHILRDRQMMAFAWGMPVILLLLFGYGMSFDIEHIPLAVVDEERTPASRALASDFTAGDVFRDVAHPADAAAVETLFRAGLVRAA